MMVKGISHLCCAAALIVLGACSHVDLQHPRDKARILAGSSSEDAKWQPITAIAPLYAQYAVLAALAYDDSFYGLRTGHASDIERCVGDQPCGQIEAQLRQVRAIWGDRPLFARINDCSDPAKGAFVRDFDHGGRKGRCDQDQPGKTRVLDGLGIQVWARRADPCGELVIAFRGTDAHQSDDWLSNFRWVTRYAPLHDQYEQVREHIDGLIAEAKSRTGCTPRRITTIGHSLGGGLAQHAAYAQNPKPGQPRITRVYAFNSSFVTGYRDRALQDGRLPENIRALKIDRVYEHGEILAYPRFVLRQMLQPTACSPQLRLVRVNLSTGNVAQQHAMALLARQLLTVSPRTLARSIQNEERVLPHAPEAVPATGECVPRARAT